MIKIADNQNIIMVAVVAVVALVGIVTILNNDNDAGAVVVNSGSELTGQASWDCFYSCADWMMARNRTSTADANQCKSWCGF